MAGLSQRPVWQGHLHLSLVSCAVGLYKATTTANDISFNLINPKTGNRIRMITTDPDTGPVERSSLVKGYAVEKNNYVLFSDEELQSVKLETTRTRRAQERECPAQEREPEDRAGAGNVVRAPLFRFSRRLQGRARPLTLCRPGD
jgi:DNA end-binding protein Ku